MSATSSLAAPAFASAWTQAPKETQSISSVSHARIDNGDLWRAESLIETGVAEGWAVNFKVETETRFSTLSQTDNRTAARVGLQKSFALGDRSSASIMASYLGGDSLDGPFCSGDGYEGRGAIGTSFSLFGRNTFVNAEAGWRTRGDGCERALAEIGAGMDVAPDWTIMVKSWAEDGDEGRSTKIEASLLHDFGPLALGLGWREEVSGAFEEKGWLVSAWSSF